MLDATSLNEQEPNGTATVAQALPNGVCFELTGSISSLSDVDYFSIALNEGESLTVNVEATNPSAPANAQFDPVIGIFDPNNVLVATDDDSGVGSRWASALTYTTTTAGLWKVAISDYFDFTFGGVVGNKDGFGTDTGAYIMDISRTTTVRGRSVFYNNSQFDGNSAGAAAADDGAIATDKFALLPNQPASIANYTSYSRGINGIMVDLAAA